MVRIAVAPLAGILLALLGVLVALHQRGAPRPAVFVDLPRVSTDTIVCGPDPITVSITRQGALYLERQALRDLDELRARVSARLRIKALPVVLQADAGLDVAAVYPVLMALRDVDDRSIELATRDVAAR